MDWRELSLEADHPTSIQKEVKREHVGPIVLRSPSFVPISLNSVGPSHGVARS